MLKRSALAALALAGFASGALAQNQPPPQAQPPQSPPNFGARPSSAMGIYGNGTQMTLLRMSMNDDAHSDVTPAQRRRAQQAAVLIKANRCEDAYNMALAEQDNRLALNIAVACKAYVRQ